MVQLVPPAIALLGILAHFASRYYEKKAQKVMPSDKIEKKAQYASYLTITCLMLTGFFSAF